MAVAVSSVACSLPVNGEGDAVPAPSPTDAKPAGDASASTPTSAQLPAPQPSSTGTPAEACCWRNAQASGVCVATQSLPPSVQANVLQESCANGQTCMPTDFIKNTPRTCSAGSNGPGVCLNTCFSLGLMFGEIFGTMAQAWECRPGEVCAPCNQAAIPIPGCS